MTSRYFDDFAVGDKLESGRITVSEEDILAYAAQFDPQYFHLDPERAADGPFGGLVASGFHTLSLSMGLFFRLGVIEEANLGSPGFDNVRWLKPLRPGDSIRQIAEVRALKPSRSKPDRGVIWMRHETYNQLDQAILRFRCMHMLRRR